MNKVNKIVERKMDILTTKKKNKDGEIIYELSFSHDKFIKEHEKSLEKNGFKLKDNKWICLLE